MSTNYYVVIGKCPHCGRDEEKIHIGKTSCGWSFTFHGYESQKIVDFESWKEFVKDKHIIDEYDRDVPFEDLLNKIESCRKDSNNHFLFCDFC